MTGTTKIDLSTLIDLGTGWDKEDAKIIEGINQEFSSFLHPKPEFSFLEEKNGTLLINLSLLGLILVRGLNAIRELENTQKEIRKILKEFDK